MKNLLCLLLVAFLSLAPAHALIGFTRVECDAFYGTPQGITKNGELTLVTYKGKEGLRFCMFIHKGVCIGASADGIDAAGKKLDVIVKAYLKKGEQTSDLKKLEGYPKDLIAMASPSGRVVLFSPKDRMVTIYTPLCRRLLQHDLKEVQKQ